MKYGLAALAVVLVVVGAAFFYIPTPVPTATGGEAFSMYRWQALMPRQIALGLMVLGAVLGLIAWAMPTKQASIPNAPYESFRSRLGAQSHARRRSSK